MRFDGTLNSRLAEARGSSRGQCRGNRGEKPAYPHGLAGLHYPNDLLPRGFAPVPRGGFVSLNDSSYLPGGVMLPGSGLIQGKPGRAKILPMRKAPTLTLPRKAGEGKREDGLSSPEIC